MKVLVCLTFAIMISSVVSDGTLDINSDACTVYTDKFGTAAKNGKGTTKLAFSGTVNFVPGSADATVKFAYSDDVLFNNSTFFGLVTEDGQKPENTCLNLRLYKYTSSSFSDPSLVTDLAITNEKDEATRWRYYVINFKGAELKTRLIETESTAYYTYTGYYGLVYLLQGTQQIQYTHLFSFILTVNKGTSAVVDTAFLPLSASQSISCTECNVTPVSSLLFCTDSSCATTTTSKTIYLNENFWMLHKITTSGLGTYKLSNSEVRYVAEGLNKKAAWAKDYTVTYSTGQAIYPLKATLAWDKLKIQASTSLLSGRRILSEAATLRVLVEDTNALDSAQGLSDAVDCIKDSTTDKCMTCDQICEQNCGIAPSTCTCTQKVIDDCPNFVDQGNNSIMVAISAILLLVLF